MVIQVALPQLCTKNVPEKQVQAKSDLSKQIAETGKKCLEVNIEGKDVFESIPSRPAPPAPAPFVFSSTLAEKKSFSQSFYDLKQGHTTTINFII